MMMMVHLRMDVGRIRFDPIRPACNLNQMPLRRMLNDWDLTMVCCGLIEMWSRLARDTTLTYVAMDLMSPNFSTSNLVASFFGKVV